MSKGETAIYKKSREGTFSFRQTSMSSPLVTPTKRKKMQIKAVTNFVKRLRRQLKKLGSHSHSSQFIDNSITVTAAATTTIVPLLAGAFSPLPLTSPASPRSGCSSVTLSKSPVVQAKNMERSDSAGTASTGEALTTESGLTSVSATTGEDAKSQQVADTLEDSLQEATGVAVKEQSAGDELTDSLSSLETHDELPRVSSPPPEHVEPEVPDPFLLDDPEDPLSDEELGASVLRAPADEISLARSSSQPASPVTPITPLTPNVNKNVPPPPETDEDEDDSPELYLPGLVLPAMFLPVPNTDPLTTLLTKYISQPEKRPVRDLTGDWQRSDFHTLVMTNSWRALARMARDRIVTTNPEELGLILGLWYLRLSSLARLRLYNQTSAELTNLFTVLNAVDPPSAREWLFDHILPFELEVMYARIKYWAGDHMGHLDALNGLLRKCRTKARAAKGDDAVRAMWQERGARVCLITASQLMEMKDYAAAAHLLEPLGNQGPSISTSALKSSIARIYLQSGYLAKASQHFAAVETDPGVSQAVKDMNAALLASAKGDWPQASEKLKNLLADDSENFVAVNNLSVALLGQGKLKEGIEVLETALKTSPSTVVVAEPFLFNLSTLYELRSATAVDKKRDLLVEVAKWSGDGLKTTCLKMPSN